MTTIRLMLSAAIAAGLLSGCNMLKNSNKVTATPAATQSSPQVETPVDTRPIDRTLYGQWIVMDVNGARVTGDERPYVTFDTVATNPYLAKFYAFNGCNFINGQVAVTAAGSMKKASEYLSTMAFCPDAQYELGMSMVLDNIKSYKIEKVADDCLMYLTGADKNQKMVLRRSDMAWLNGAWEVRRIDNRVLDGNNKPQIVIDLPQLHLHGNTGCNVLNGSIVTNPDVQNSIRFTNLSTTRMMCPDAAVEQAFVEALGRVASVDRNRTDNDADLRDASGSLVIELHRIDLKALREE